MPQVQLPIFPDGVTAITSEIAFERREGKVCYFNGHLPVFIHDCEDLAAFRLFSSQLVINGNATQSQISRAFGVPLVTVKRYVKLYREAGPRAFFAPPPRRKGSKLTPQVLERAQTLLDERLAESEIAHRLGVLGNTLNKAIHAGRLHKRAQRKDEGRSAANASGRTKSQRSVADSQAPLGCGATRTLDRVAAAIGVLHGAPIEFEHVEDVPCGGVLLALPALLQNGLLAHSRAFFSMPEGYYRLESIFLLLAFMALGRIRSLEALRYQAPGEWGKLMGLDRIPEVRTLRDKLGALCSQAGQAAIWSGTLAKEWLEEQASESAGVYYADGHVRVYHGKLTKLPRRYIARERLCQRGTTDYWINAMDGQPFFVVTRPVDPGLLGVLREEIVPRLERDVPGQPDAAALQADPLRCRFTLVFDREGYSPSFFAEMKDKRIAILSYHKFPGEAWPQDEFRPCKVTLVHGEEVQMQLAERGTRLSNGLWVREVRRRSESGAQSSILCTDYRAELTRMAACMFARWCQENFFKYMREHYHIDRLVEYGCEPLPETTRVVNPRWRALDAQVRHHNGKLTRELAEFAAAEFPSNPNSADIEKWEHQKATLQQTIQERRGTIATLKDERKAAGKHIEMKDLPPEDHFRALHSEKKHFVDTIKLIAYRAETAMAALAREHLARPQDARSLMRQLFESAVDLLPDRQARTLTVRLHRLSAQVHDDVIARLCDELTATETDFPGTDLRLIFEFVASS